MKTLLVDFNNYCFRFLNQAYFKDQMLYSLTTFGADKVVVFADGGRSKYRKEIYPEYKANRATHEKDLTDFYAECEATYKALPYHKYRLSGVEADDLIAYYASLSKEDLILISSDRDFDQIPNIKRFNFLKNEYQEWKHPFDRSCYILYKCLLGDKGDNIVGVKNVGEKRATDLTVAYGTIEKLIESLPIKVAPTYIEAINNSADLLRLNKKLMDLELAKDYLPEEAKAEVKRLVEL